MPAKSLQEFFVDFTPHGTVAVFIENNFFGGKVLHYIEIITFLTFVDNLANRLGNMTVPSKFILTGYEGWDYKLNIAVRRFGYKPIFRKRDENGDGWRIEEAKRLSGLENKHVILVGNGGHSFDGVISALDERLGTGKILSLVHLTHSQVFERDKNDRSLGRFYGLLESYNGVLVLVDQELHLFS